MTAQTGQNRRTATPPSPKPTRPIRQADFTVKSQLLGKLGPRGYGRLLEQLRKVTG